MARIDFEQAARFIAAVPTGRWTSYKDVATAGGNALGAQAVGEWLRRNGDVIPHPWRVLRTDGFVAEGFRGAGPDLPRDAASARNLLRSEGVVIASDGRARQQQRFRTKHWTQLEPGTSVRPDAGADRPVYGGNDAGQVAADTVSRLPVESCAKPTPIDTLSQPAARGADAHAPRSRSGPITSAGAGIAPTQAAGTPSGRSIGPIRSDVLPVWVAHADWGTDAAKRVVATAELRDGVYVAHAPRTVGAVGGLLERMYIGGGPSHPSLLGFDFPIGVPRACAHRAGIKNFAEWFRQLDQHSAFFDVAAEIGEVSIERPFFPRRITTKSPGIKEEFRAALGLSSWESLRRTDRAHGKRGAASEMFWTLGPKAVGKATLAGWRDTLLAALAEPARRYAIWPYDGPLFDLLARFDAVIAETYPADSYRQLGLRMGLPGTAKTNQAHRRTDARRLLARCDNTGVIADDDLTRQIEEGFGASKTGEDLFDAVVGLFGMINTVSRGTEPELPDDPAVRQLEGWIFGQPAGPSRPTLQPAHDSAGGPLLAPMRQAGSEHSGDTITARTAVRLAQDSARGSSPDADGSRMPVKTVAILAKASDPAVPDWTKQTHDPSCFIVLRHEEGAWEFRHPKRTWLTIPTIDVPADVGRCMYCGGGR